MDARKTLITRSAILTLVGVLACTEPLTLLAQQRGTLPAPRSPRLPPGVFQTGPDPVLDAITADMIATLKDAHQHGPRLDHLKRHAANMRALAKYYKTTDVDAQVKAWANAQNPDVFELQVPDRATVDAALAFRHQQGLPVDDILAAVNASPQVKRAALLALQSKGISGNLDDDAAFLERMVATGGEPQIAPVGTTGPYSRSPDQTDQGPGQGGVTFGGCGILGAIGSMTGFLSLIPGFGIGFGIVGGLLGIYNLAGCPGCPCQGTNPHTLAGSRLPRREVAIWKV